MKAMLMFVLITVICLINILTGHKVRSAARWANDGKNLNWVTVGILLITFQIGGTSTIGAAQNGYALDIGGAWYGVTDTVAMVLFIFFITHSCKYIAEDTISNFMKNRYSSSISSLYSYAYLIMGLVYIPIQLFTVITIFHAIIPALDLTWARIISLVLAISYVVMSGVSGANYVSKVGCILMCATMAVSLIPVMRQTGSFATLATILGASYSNLFTMPARTWFSWFLTCFVAFLTVQAAIQPSLIAKGNASAKKGILFGTILNLPCGFICALLGVVCIIMSSDVGGNSSLAFATVIDTYCPNWFTTLLSASIILIVICTLTGQLLAICVIIRQLSLPVYQRKQISERTRLTYTRLIVFVYGFITIIPTLMIQQSFLNELVTILVACITGPMFFALVAGVFWEKMSTKAAGWSTVSGIVVDIIRVLTGMSASWHPVYIILPVFSLVGFTACELTSSSRIQHT